MLSMNTDEMVFYSCYKDENVLVGASYGPTVRSHYIIECCTVGEATHYINGRAFPLKPGQGIVFFPGDTTVHKTCGTEPRCGYWCCLDGKGVGEAFARAGISSEAPYLPPETARRVTLLMQDIYSMNRENDGGAELRRNGFMLAVIGEILRSTAAKEPGSLYVRRALGVMESRYGEDLSVAEIAREVGLERSYFSTLFRRETGRTPKETLTELRVRRASALLRSTDLPVSEIASACGIPPENFSRIFRSVSGSTPLAYRRQSRA